MYSCTSIFRLIWWKGVLRWKRYLRPHGSRWSRGRSQGNKESAEKKEGLPKVGWGGTYLGRAHLWSERGGNLSQSPKETNRKSSPYKIHPTQSYKWQNIRGRVLWERTSQGCGGWPRSGVFGKEDGLTQKQDENWTTILFIFMHLYWWTKATSSIDLSTLKLSFHISKYIFPWM